MCPVRQDASLRRRRLRYAAAAVQKQKAKGKGKPPKPKSSSHTGRYPQEPASCRRTPTAKVPTATASAATTNTSPRGKRSVCVLETWRQWSGGENPTLILVPRELVPLERAPRAPRTPRAPNKHHANMPCLPFRVSWPGISYPLPTCQCPPGPIPGCERTCEVCKVGAPLQRLHPLMS